jgi:hypothetical protein
MTMDITDSSIAVWSVQMEDSDWIGHLTRLGTNKFAIEGRFRYYVDDRLEGSKDRKNWYHGEILGSEQEVLRNCRRLFDSLRSVTKSPGWELLRGARSVKEFSEELLAMPGVHIVGSI